MKKEENPLCLPLIGEEKQRECGEKKESRATQLYSIIDITCYPYMIHATSLGLHLFIAA